MLPQVSRDERRKQRKERVLEEKLLRSLEDPNEFSCRGDMSVNFNGHIGSSS